MVTSCSTTAPNRTGRAIFRSLKRVKPLAHISITVTCAGGYPSLYRPDLFSSFLPAVSKKHVLVTGSRRPVFLCRTMATAQLIALWVQTYSWLHENVPGYLILVGTTLFISLQLIPAHVIHPLLRHIVSKFDSPYNQSWATACLQQRQNLLTFVRQT